MSVLPQHFVIFVVIFNVENVLGGGEYCSHVRFAFYKYQTKEICVCILLVHEIPWTFTSSKFIDIFFLHDSMPRAYKTKWVKVDIFIQSVLNMS